MKAQDSTGAGDSFAAGFIAGFLGGLDWSGAAVLGNAMGAMAAAHIGAGTATIKGREVMALLGSHRHEPSHCDCVDAIQQAMDFMTTLDLEPIEPEEEGKPWWK